MEVEEGECRLVAVLDVVHQGAIDGVANLVVLGNGRVLQN